MPRRTRIQLRRAFYHIMLRGNYRQNIFQDSDDKLTFYRIMSICSKKYDHKVHVFCLMSNHIHMVIETGDIPISKVMQSISTRYVMYHNKKVQKQGRLFQGRFRSILIQDEAYLLELLFYIHMNPVKANMVASLDHYDWSSHPVYLGAKPLSWLTTSYIFKLLQDHVKVEQNFYLYFMENWKAMAKKPKYCHLDENGNLLIEQSMHEKNKSASMLLLNHCQFKTIIDVVCDTVAVSISDVKGASLARKIVEARAIIAYFAHYHAHYLLSDIAHYFCIQQASLSKTMHRYLIKKQNCKLLQEKFRRVECRLLSCDLDRSELGR